MTFVDAFAKLKLRTAWDSTPAVTEDDLADILDDARLTDALGNTPSDPSWGSPVTTTTTAGNPPVTTTETTTPGGSYDLILAAQRTWERKAGNAALLIDFSDPDQKNAMSQIKDHCDEMAASFAKRRSRTLAAADGQGRSLALLPWQIGNGPQPEDYL